MTPHVTVFSDILVGLHGQIDQLLGKKGEAGENAGLKVTILIRTLLKAFSEVHRLILANYLPTFLSCCITSDFFRSMRYKGGCIRSKSCRFGKKD